MKPAFSSTPRPAIRQVGRFLVVALIILALGGAVAYAYLRPSGEAPKVRNGAPVPVVSALVTVADVPVRLSANGTVSALQSVEVRAQISATIKAVHVREGQFVQAGQRLFSLDVRTEDADIGRAEAQVLKSRADLANAERNLQRQRELFAQKFISQTALDTVQSQVESLRAQVAADQATVESSRVARGFGEILAPIAGRLGAIAVYPGSLVQPTGLPLVSIAQIDPINVSFAMPESELPALQKSLAGGGIAVKVTLDEADSKGRTGRLSFIDNNVDSASGTIRVKASFANGDGRLWPGMFVKVALAPRTVSGALVVPVQAVQTGPEQRFVYVIGDDGKVSPLPVRVALVQEGRAVIEGAPAGTRVVVEGAQNLRPGSVVVEAAKEAKKAASDAQGKS
jgi:RND family efflux transporter MFP subunit